MPACNVEREMVGGTSIFRIAGKFDGAGAWDLSRRIEKEALAELALDFSQVSEFVDYGVAVIANALLSIPHKRVHLQGLRQHQLRLFKYFGVDPEEMLLRTGDDTLPPSSGEPLPLASEVA
jgi:anti-anti-sigma regulatory factor